MTYTVRHTDQKILAFISLPISQTQCEAKNNCTHCEVYTHHANTGDVDFENSNFFLKVQDRYSFVPSFSMYTNGL